MRLKRFFVIGFILAVQASYAIAAGNGNSLTFPVIPATVYGSADFDPGATSTVGTITYTSSNLSVATIVPGGIHVVGVGTSIITASDQTNTLTQLLSVSPATLTIAADSKSGASTYPLPPLTVSYSGFVNGDTPASLTTLPTISTTATRNSPTGNYPITVSGAAAINYSILYVQGTLAMAPASFVTSAIPVKTYGGPDFYEFGQNAPGMTYSSNNTAVATIVNGEIHIVGAGTATIMANNGGNSINKTLTVNKAPLTVIANGTTGISGYPIPALTVSYSGFVNGDAPASLTAQPIASTTANSSSPKGNYPITVSGGASANYTFNYMAGNLLLAPNSYYTYTIPVKTYGDADFYEFGQNVPGLIYTTSNPAVASIVNGEIHITGAGTVTIIAKNSSQQLSKTLTVNQAPLYITTNYETRPYGLPNPPLTVYYQGFVNGDTPASLTTQPVSVTTADVSSPIGTYPITSSGAVDPNYIITYSPPGVMTITPSNGTGAPDISDPAAEVYTADNSISPVTPINTGGPVPATIYALVSTVAGSGTPGASNGPGTDASFNQPHGMVTDAAGNVYVADFGNHVIRKITPAGVVSTFAGSGAPGYTDGPNTVASFVGPTDLAIDAAGNLYVADLIFIRKINPAGTVSTLAGNPTPGSVNGTGTAASFFLATGVATDAAGNVYVADEGNNLIRKITPAGVVTTYAGTGTSGAGNGAAAKASFNSPNGVATDAAGNVHVSDYVNALIRKITPAGKVSTLAGGGTITGPDLDGTGSAAVFEAVECITTDPIGNIYVGDEGMLRKITPDGVVTTIAGASYRLGDVNAVGSLASFSQIYGIAEDATGNMYISDYGNELIRKAILTGYSISPALPPNLNFDATTGTISGTPAGAFPSQDYTITAYNIYGSSSTVINITITDDDPDGSNIVKPPVVHTAVSPNGDGVNDVLAIDNIANYPDNELTLMNAQGSKVFEVSGYDNLNKAFNGRSNITGKQQAAGTYFYLLRYRDAGVMKSKSGYFVIKY